MFSEIELKAEQNERLRQMIFNGDAGRVDEFAIFIYTYADDTSMPTDLVGQPGLIRTDDGFTKALFVINGYIFEIYIESETGEFPLEVLSETIKPTNDINIYYFPEGMAREFLLKYYILRNANT
jgi:hypothetical protein